MGELVPLSVLALDVGVPALGWTHELGRHNIRTVVDGIGRECIRAEDARTLVAAHHEDQARRARARREAEEQAVKADQAFRRSLPPGIPVSLIPSGVTGAEVMTANDPDRARGRRQSILQHALENDGAVIFTPLRGDAA